MLCSRARTALSARLDAEELPPGVTGRRLREHLAECAGCRAWEAGALRLQRAVDGGSVGGAESAGDAPRADSDNFGTVSGSSGNSGSSGSSGSSGREAC
ncbi:zf-HC2 domain-containing protein [Streptomyces sp. HNM0575]|uniref:zf-HC2 domain-containing protein n=1 Tax=Streptomyces sp. HNM0575 TaxID=2716338 RepID=UPI00145DC8AB|nr:zf-HC2 domain-containing protein [Streptomyces sp. HNM0575]NLU72674.1 zf-HC2 domain-containing protein [Streptomyces sp. HNM0575]